MKAYFAYTVMVTVHDCKIEFMIVFRLRVGPKLYARHDDWQGRPDSWLLYA